VAAKRYSILVLGAGFSKPAGFPLASELWAEVRRRAAALGGRASKFREDLASYVRYRRLCDGIELSEEDIDFEDFMRFLDIEHFLELRGSDTWSHEGNEGTIVAKTLIGRILAELTPPVEDVPELYVEFARRLQPDDSVLTFNYDVLLERTLEATGKPYRLFPLRYDSASKHTATVGDSRDEVRVIKLHGSIDWFDRTLYGMREKECRKHGLTASRPHPVFAHLDELGVTKLLDGPRFDDDPLNQMYRVRNVKALYQKELMFRATPCLMAPSSVKILYAQRLRDFWWGLGHAGALNFGLAIIGFSLAPQDDYARQVIYRLVRNYQASCWGEEFGGLKKSPLVVVNRCRDHAELDSLKQRYRFVDWKRAALCADGLNQEALDRVFGDT